MVIAPFSMTAKQTLVRHMHARYVGFVEICIQLIDGVRRNSRKVEDAQV